MIALDANIFIYVLEGNDQFGPLASDLFERLDKSAHDVCASELVFAETLSSGNMTEKNADQALRIIKEFRVRFYPITDEILLLAAKLRRARRLRLPDAVHLANAIVHGADALVTNDHKLIKYDPKDLRIIPLGEASSLISYRPNT